MNPDLLGFGAAEAFVLESRAAHEPVVRGAIAGLIAGDRGGTWERIASPVEAGAHLTLAAARGSCARITKHDGYHLVIVRHVINFGG